MFIQLIKKRDIQRCQQLFRQSLIANLEPQGEYLIGHKGNSFRNEIFYNSENRLWYSEFLDKESAIPRYWNGFGIGLQPNGTQKIIVEINIPIEGVSGRVSGIFAKDYQSDEYLLLHRGRIGGGRRGIGKQAFKNFFRGTWVEVIEPDGKKSEAILVSRLNSPRLLDHLINFISEVNLFKNISTRGSRNFNNSFSPEFFGTKKGTRSSDLEYESFHGKVVNELAKYLESNFTLDARVFNTKAIDLGVELDGQPFQIFEVKSSAESQSIYTGIGQLIFHSSNWPDLKKFLVIPTMGNSEELQRIMSVLNISLIGYFINKGKVSFTNIDSVLNSLP